MASLSLTTSQTTPLPPLPSLQISSTNPSLRESHQFTATAHWIIPQILMQGGRPGASSSQNHTPLIDQIRLLVREAKCTSFVCLQAECQPLNGAELLGDGGCQDWLDPNQRADLVDYHEEVEQVARENLTEGQPEQRHEKRQSATSFLHYGIRNMETATSLSSLSEIVYDLAWRIQSNGEVLYLHCWGGKGRAGIVSACLLGVLYPELSADNALSYVNELCQLRNMEGTEGVRFHSPETDEQKEQVREFFRSIRS